MFSQVAIDFDTPIPVEYTRKKWFIRVKGITRWFVKKPKFVFLGKPLSPRSIVLSNHEGASVPLSLELYSNLPIRFWGTHEMNEDMKAAYGYQTNIYYHKKKCWNLWLARVFCLLATPLTKMFYNGLDLISTYPDIRLKNTLSRSVAALRKGHTVVIFPEDSDNGYLREMTKFHQGALMLMNYCQRQQMDLPVYVAYFKKDTKEYVVDAPIQISELLGQGFSREELAERLCRRCNELGKMDLSQVQQGA